MNEDWLDAPLEEQGEYTTSVGQSEGHKDKHQNVDVPIPAWPLYIAIPLILAYVHFRKRR